MCLEMDRDRRSVNMKPFVIGYKLVPIKIIPIRFLENEEDWEFVWLKDGRGAGHAAVF